LTTSHVEHGRSTRACWSTYCCSASHCLPTYLSFTTVLAGIGCSLYIQHAPAFVSEGTAEVQLGCCCCR
jgi:hypothetical protein